MNEEKKIPTFFDYPGTRLTMLEKNVVESYDNHPYYVHGYVNSGWLKLEGEHNGHRYSIGRRASKNPFDNAKLSHELLQFMLDYIDGKLEWADQTCGIYR